MQQSSLVEEMLQSHSIPAEIRRVIPFQKLIDISAATTQFYASYVDGRKAVEWNAGPPFESFICEFPFDENMQESGYSDAAIFVQALQFEEDRYRGMGVDDARWTLHFWVFYRTTSGHIAMVPRPANIFVRQDGGVLTRGGEILLGLTGDSAPRDFTEHFTHEYITPVLFALTLLNLPRGVTMESSPYSRPPKKLLRCKNLPKLQHHIIVIRDAKGRSVDTGALQSGIRQRLHIRRGHFRTYTASAPLFGHFVGRVWVPAYIAGNAEAGEITSEYRI